ncbi:hypothetical protein LTR53_004632 [Teratosphaeriaceae sp. CCFEE 6253]|nr:hypothetical protein LTR53_004632 [Teratosphaeriaceae sp. CCFEE 6253]
MTGRVRGLLDGEERLCAEVAAVQDKEEQYGTLDADMKSLAKSVAVVKKNVAEFDAWKCSVNERTAMVEEDVQKLMGEAGHRLVDDEVDADEGRLGTLLADVKALYEDVTNF